MYESPHSFPHEWDRPKGGKAAYIEAKWDGN